MDREALYNELIQNEPFSLIFVGGFFLVLSLIGIRQQVRFENGYDDELETDQLAMIGPNRK